MSGVEEKRETYFGKTLPNETIIQVEPDIKPQAQYKKNDWHEALLGTLCRVVGGGTPSRANPIYWQGEIPWASVKDFSNNSFYLDGTEEHISNDGLLSSASRLVPENTPLICTRMAVGRCALTVKPTAINQDVKALIPNESILPKFLVRLLSFYSESLERIAIGSTVKGISTDQLLNLRVKYPEISEQRRIAVILDTLDAAIEKSEALIAKLKQVRAGMLHDLLTYGVDENGEIRDSEIYPHHFKNSPLGLVPINWELTNLANISEFITSGSRGWASFYSDQGGMFIRIGNLTRDHINLRFDDIQYVTPPRSAEGQRTKVEGNDLLVSITADLGIIGMIPPGFGEAYVNQHIALIRLKSKINSPRWIGHLLSSHPYQKIFQSLNDSGAKAGLNLSTLASLPIALPQSEAEQQRIVETLDALDEDIATQISALEKLRQAKAGLGSDLLTGQTRIPTNLEIP